MNNMLNIKQRQMNLKFLNFYKGNIDGIEGMQAKQATKEFQKAYNLVQDGIYGAKTDSKLVSLIKDIQSKIGTSVDGIAGTNTINSCKTYQSNNGLAADGICGTNTRAKLAQNDWGSIKYFKKEEFDCPCCKLNNINIAVVKVADQIREHFGSAATVNSGTRCVKHNKEVDGVADSRHLTGKAIDLYVKGVTGDRLLAYAQGLVKQGKLRYTYRISKNGSAVHIDIN